MYNPLVKEYRGRFGKGRTMDDIVDLVDELPPMPDVITHALRLVDDPSSTPEELANVIMLDPALASPILRSANSASLGHQREVTTLSMAILLVGMGQIKTILLASALRRWNGKFGPVERLVWEKSIGAASAAHVLCQQLKKDYLDELYLTGLLHNLGQIVLLSHKELGGEYPGVLARIRECNEDYVTAEREVIGFSHPLIGALVAWKWGFAPSTCRAILHYNEPLVKTPGEHDEKVAMLKLAAGMGLALGFGRPEGYSEEIEKLDKLAAFVGFNEATLQADMQIAMSEIKIRFASEVGAYG
ncbi:MAG: HDOD domain-containing protein [Limisphaerales bacterium]